MWNRKIGNLTTGQTKNDRIKNQLLKAGGEALYTKGTANKSTSWTGYFPIHQDKIDTDDGSIEVHLDSKFSNTFRGEANPIGLVIDSSESSPILFRKQAVLNSENPGRQISNHLQVNEFKFANDFKLLSPDSRVTSTLKQNDMVTGYVTPLISSDFKTIKEETIENTTLNKYQNSLQAKAERMPFNFEDNVDWTKEI